MTKTKRVHFCIQSTIRVHLCIQCEEREHATLKRIHAGRGMARAYVHPRRPGSTNQHYVVTPNSSEKNRMMHMISFQNYVFRYIMY